MSNSPRGFREEPYGNKRNGIYLGLVRKNFDGQRMGRLMVWVSDFGPDEPEYWYAVSYASPFAGTTPVEDNKEGGQTDDDSQKSYGFWATPPDVGNQVLVCFLNGDIAQGYWFACLYPQNMNHMVPGIGSTKPSTDPTMDEKFALYGPPTVEYNKKDTEIKTPTSNAQDRESVRRPVFTPLAEGLIAQGLTDDPERGTSNSSARRESPSRVFGMLSPRGNSIHIDDGPQIKDQPENEFIRLRTRSGAQILIHETSGYIYMITKGGNSWVEISDGGIDMYSSGTISMSGGGDVNIHAGGKVGIHGEQGVHIRGGAITAYSEGNFDVAVKGNFTMETIGDTNFLANLDFNVQTTGDISHNAGRNIIEGACGIMSRNALFLLDNAGGPTPNDVEHPEVLEEVVSRIPAHEPFDHLISTNTSDATGEDADGNAVVDVVGSDGTVTQQPVPVPKGITDEDIDWITTCVISEARGETEEGKAAVVRVILNRVATDFRENAVNPKFRKRAKGIILALYAFSEFNARGHVATERKGQQLMSRYMKHPSWAATKALCQKVITNTYFGGNNYNRVGGDRCLWYYAPKGVKSAPKFARVHKFVCVVGGHRFYKRTPGR